MADPGRARVVVTDTAVLINLIHVARLDLLGSLVAYEFVVPPEVEAELVVPDQVAALDQAIDAGHLTRLSFSGTSELELFVEFARVLGNGESACLAMAEVRGWYVASDERRRFRRLAEERIGRDRILNTPGLYLAAIRGGLLTVDQADHDKRMLEARRFKMRFASFRDVLDTRGED
jgi:predicted nucleic acid-binding protein